MKANKCVITLEEQDLLALQALLMDRDKDGALEFLETCVARRLPKKGTAPCDSSRLNPVLLGPGSSG